MKISEETEELDLDEEVVDEDAAMEIRPTFPVVGAVLTDRRIKFQIFKNLMASLWRPGKGVSIKEIHKKKYLFTFDHSVDMKRVLDGGPWSFEKNLLILKEVKPDDIPLKIELNETKFWVQVHNVSYSLMNLCTARGVGNYIGIFVKYDMMMITLRGNEKLICV
ncbi:unnamed protein product [Cuscuta epithymum]|uniref:DUF4283 domain-containing protein n=1 Tax=Cuscuta epithymum TaxID=186058 RepID=A0AAV0EQP8_9ASTE|nr:unnamed protein product [Cuscuta epithymum]